MPYGDKKSYSFFKMEGHALPGPFQKKIWPPGSEKFDIEKDIIQKESKILDVRKSAYDILGKKSGRLMSWRPQHDITKKEK